MGILIVTAIAAALAVPATLEPAHSSLPWAEFSVGMTKSSLAKRLDGAGHSLHCTPVVDAEVPVHAAEACRTSEQDDGGAIFLMARSLGSEPRLIAYSVTGPAAQTGGVAGELSERYGKPLRILDTPWGQSTIWLQAGRQISLREACAPGRFCVEVSADTFARRVARSTGLFVPATPGS